MNEPKKELHIVYDYWIDHDTNKVYAIYIKEGILYFLESEMKK